MNLFNLFQNVTTFVLDVDGVLTDGSLLVMPGGVMARRMNIKDGYALQLAVKKNYRVVIISGGNAPEVKERLEKLGVHEVYMNTTDKPGILRQLLETQHLPATEILFMGDDIPDLAAMQLAGVRCCPQDAITEIKSISQYISPVKGGEGCVREVIEKVMKLRGDWSEDATIAAR